MTAKQKEMLENLKAFMSERSAALAAVESASEDLVYANARLEDAERSVALAVDKVAKAFGL